LDVSHQHGRQHLCLIKILDRGIPYESHVTENAAPVSPSLALQLP
jgi:hypothetical protein